MKSKTLRNGLAALITVTIVAVGANAMAGKGMGYGRDGQGCGGYGQGQGKGGCGYGPRWADLTDEQREQMEAERQTFFDATKQARQDLYAKRLALKAEMAKSAPEMKTAQTLQKEISTIEADLDQKRLTHIMAMRKINPDAGRGFFGDGPGKGHRGPGHHYGKGRGMGYGPENCPFN